MIDLKKLHIRILFMSLIIFLSVLSGAFSSGNQEIEDYDGTEVSAYPPPGWITDIYKAYKIAKKENKNILVNFTGSDWCIWCEKLRDEVFSKKEFLEYAEDNLILLFIDFPNNIKLSEDQISHNELISDLLGVKGFPTIWLLDKDLNPLLVTGYLEGGTDFYIDHLKNDRSKPDVTDEERKIFRDLFVSSLEAELGPLKE